MAIITEIEEKLLKCITDEHLQISLGEIRQATEKIWATDAPRIIQDYTDHGIKHSERLAYFVDILLELSDGKDLSSKEMYILLSGIYLHDIGMQCDVAKFPDIKNKAIELGAQFEVNFKSKTSSGYTIEEQKALRKNHQYLSAAWIYYGYQTGNTALGHAAKNIPKDLLYDLMDVCKYHAKLPIIECPLNFRFDSNERKQLIAALLRFSDELDIDSNRVSIETVKNFNLDPGNSIYWWLHNQTKIVISGNVITITIRLHPEDAKKYSSFIYDAFITKFQNKNRSVLSLLVQNRIPLVISNESNVVEFDLEDQLPKEIIPAFKSMQRKGKKLDNLAGEIKNWLEAIGYDVNPMKSLDKHFLDVQATFGRGLMSQKVHVRCFEGEISKIDLEILSTQPSPQKWAITDKRVAPSAREYAESDNSLKVFNLTEFMHLIWGPYFDALKTLVERNQIPSMYVDLGCYKQIMDEMGNEIDRDEHTSLDKYIDDWLTERGKGHISILGDFGAGKTWFCRHYAYRQLDRYLKDPVNERLPLLITLRSFAKAMTAQQLINDALMEQYRLPFVGSAFEIFQEMNRRGKLLLILDGFDEMARQVDYQTVVDNFWELAEMVDENSKVILTSRKEYFHWAKESEKILGGEEFGRRTILLSPPKFEVLYIEPFSSEQIKKVIMLRKGDKEGAIVAKKIFKINNLAEMARKPILIELLLASLDEVRGDILENQAKVYLYATNKLLLRNIETKRTFTTTSDKLYFLCELAWEMINSGELSIHYTEIPVRIETYFGDRIKGKNKLDNWDFDLRNQTLLHRDAAGYYEFAHKSLAEYFVAFKFAAELGCLAQLFMQTYSEDEEKSCTIPIEKKEITELAKTFGTIALADERMHAVLDLLHEMLSKDAAKRLWEVIWETRGKTVEQVKYVGGNAATLLKTKGESFKGANMANTLLEHADLRGCQLSSANLNGCDLSGVDLTGSMFSIDSLKYAKLNKTKISIIGGGKIDLASIEIQDQEGHLDEIIRNISSKLRTIMPGFWRTTWMPGGEYSFFIRDEINDYISWKNSYIKNRKKMLDIPEIQFIAVYDNEIREINSLLPKNLIEMNF